jgi:hypothetical protein
MQVARASGNASRPSAEGLFYAAHWNAQRRRQPEKKTAQERGAHGENKYTPVQMDLFRARQAARPKRDKWVNADECEYHAEQASSNA